jgi:hypothetical protein
LLDLLFQLTLTKECRQRLPAQARLTHCPPTFAIHQLIIIRFLNYAGYRSFWNAFRVPRNRNCYPFLPRRP